MTKGKLILTVVIVVVIAGALGWYFLWNKSGAPATAPQQEAKPQTLGGNIYEKSQNPIQGRVPTLNPVANPVEGLYKNPFQ